MNESEIKQKELVKICIYLYGGCKYKSILTKTRILIYWNCKGSILLTSIVSGCRLRTIVSSSPLYTHSLTHNIVGIWQGGEMDTGVSHLDQSESESSSQISLIPKDDAFLSYVLIRKIWNWDVRETLMRERESNRDLLKFAWDFERFSDQ